MSLLTAKQRPLPNHPCLANNSQSEMVAGLAKLLIPIFLRLEAGQHTKKSVPLAAAAAVISCP